MEDRRVAFFMRAYNDIDHFAPVIAEFIKRQENPLVVFTSEIEFENDYRIIYLKTLGDCEFFKDVDFEFVKASKRDTLFQKFIVNFILSREIEVDFRKNKRRLFYNCKNS